MTIVSLPPKPFHLAGGNHPGIEKGACFNELAAVLAGEPFSDAPACVSPVIRRMGMTLNDRLDDQRRQLLRPFVLRSLGTAGDGRDEERRRMCTEWLLHYALPDLLDKADRKEAAQKLRDLPCDLAVEGVRRALREARDEAWAARTTAVGRLRDSILEEMRKRKVAGAAAGAVAGAEAAAEAVADWLRIRDAVYKAVYSKVREIVAPQFDDLVTSALDLMDRMLPESPIKVPVIEHADVICAAPEAKAA